MGYIKLRSKRQRVFESRIEFYFNKVLLGCAYREVDGFYVFNFGVGGGNWEAHILREISDILNYLNAEYSRKINEYMKENPPFSGPYPGFKE